MFTKPEREHDYAPERQPGPGGAIPLLATTVPYARCSPNSNSVTSPLRLRVPGKQFVIDIELANQESPTLSSVRICALMPLHNSAWAIVVIELYLVVKFFVAHRSVTCSPR